MVEDNFAEGLVAFLEANVAAVGNRVYPMVLPLGVIMPAITYSIVSVMRYRTLSGFSNLIRPRLQLSIWGESYQQAYELEEVVLALLEGNPAIQWADPGGVNETKVQSCFSDNELDGYEPQSGLYRMIVDFILMHES